MRNYEKDHLDKFTAKATATVNSVMERNILKLEYTHQIIAKEEVAPRSPSPTLQRMRHVNKKKREGSDADDDKPLKRPFQRMAKLVGWMTAHKHIKDEHLVFAEKILAATKSNSKVKTSDAVTEFSIQQAKCKFKLFYFFRFPTDFFSLPFVKKSTCASNETRKNSNMERGNR